MALFEFFPATGWAQAEGLPPPRTIAVDGRSMRFVAAGLAERRPGQPIVVLETGAGEPGAWPMETWRRLFPEIARFAPVLAYERRGHGLSELDTERPTMRRVAMVLRNLLRSARVPPPYVLVGQSWGGNYVRAFFDQYRDEVAGLVFVDAATGVDLTREEKAAALPAERRAEALAPPVLPPIPPGAPPGLRAEFEEIAAEMISDGRESRSLRRVAGVPVAIVVATPPGRMQGDSGAVMRLTIRRTIEYALTIPDGIFATANVGHKVHEHEPALVANLIRHVLSHAGAASAK
jgi:pimeloyl-ACP methyl ester carboxylesterase